jgi:hypothetical protein
LKAALRAAVAAGLTAFILWKSHPREVLAALAHADWRLIAVAVLLVIVDRALMAYRWVVLLCIIDPAERPRMSEVRRIFFVSTFVGTFLPASVGGDAVRAFSMTRLNVRGRDAIASVFLDRMLGVASVLLMAALGLVLAQDLAANRTIVAEDREGRLVVIVSEGGYTLWDFAHLLQRAPLGLTHAMSMDGGYEAELCVHAGDFRYASFGRWKGDAQEPSAPGAKVPLPAVIIVSAE